MVWGLSNEAIDFIAGSMGGFVAVMVGQPFDTVKVRIQTSTKYKGPADCFRQIIKNEGPRTLFSGMLAPPSYVRSSKCHCFFNVWIL